MFDCTLLGVFGTPLRIFLNGKSVTTFKSMGSTSLAKFNFLSTTPGRRATSYAIEISLQTIFHALIRPIIIYAYETRAMCVEESRK